MGSWVVMALLTVELFIIKSEIKIQSIALFHTTGFFSSYLEPHLLIMEYAMRGRLLSLLRAARGVLNGLHHPPSRQPVMPLSPRRLTGFALDIARGMEYIAEKKVCANDWKVFFENL